MNEPTNAVAGCLHIIGCRLGTLKHDEQEPASASVHGSVNIELAQAKYYKHSDMSCDGYGP